MHENFSLDFVRYTLGEPKYSVEECIERDMTYSAPLKATLQLVHLRGGRAASKRPKNIIEKEVYLGELPLLTPLGTFVINGAERVIVSQLHRSPGVVFEEATHPNGQRLISARIIPFRGSWVEFTVDIHDVIYVHIDKKKKFPATALLRAFGYGENADILRLFFATSRARSPARCETRQERREVVGHHRRDSAAGAVGRTPEDKQAATPLEPRRGRRARPRSVSTVLRQRRRQDGRGLRRLHHARPPRRGAADHHARPRRDHVLAFDVADPDTGEVVAERGATLTDTARAS